MDDILLAISVSSVAFLSTSIDNLFLLITLSVHPKYGMSRVRLGYLLAVVLMIAISLILSQGAQFIPTDFSHYVGLVPLGIGTYELYQLVAGKKVASKETSVELEFRKGTIWSVALIMLAHSWDSIAVLAPLLAETRSMLISWMAISIVLSAILLILMAQKAVSHPRLHQILSLSAPKVLPFLLIGIGLYILSNTPTDIT